MSKLAKLIEAESTGKRFAELGSYSDMIQVHSSYSNVPYGTEYSIRASFGAKVSISDEVVSTLGTQHVIGKVQRAVTEAVFGEFREPLHAIQSALWKRDYHKVEELVSALERQMFYND